MARRYLLSIDGGGIRGIIPACALAKLEETTGKPARETFSFIGGTSTGALIAAGLAAGVPAQQILNLYVDRAGEIFPRRPWNLLKRIVLGHMYSSLRLHDVISREIGEARSWTLNDSPINLLITAKRISDGTPWYFVRDTDGNSGRTGRLNLVDCVVASAAAPTYFPPWTMPEPPDTPADTEPIGTLVDGGVGVAGNPVYQSCVEAFEYTGEYRPDEATIVSLGTGKYARWSEPRWIGAWARWLLSELLRSPGEQQTELVARHYVDSLLYRIDTELKRNIALDDPRGANELLEYAQLLAARIDWGAILDGSDTEFRITLQNTQWQQYKVEVA